MIPLKKKAYVIQDVKISSRKCKTHFGLQFAISLGEYNTVSAIILFNTNWHKFNSHGFQSDRTSSERTSIGNISQVS